MTRLPAHLGYRGRTEADIDDKLCSPGLSWGYL